MIIGSGLIANSFFHAFAKHDEICIYAAGVSNSNCTNAQEFERERKRVVQALQQTMHVDAFVYFGTCSVYDPEALNTPYVQHKLAMEKLVQSHPRTLILRLPQVVGET
jgi:nucleoside-diphosphate-sugar epimerase